jgi:DNA-binding NarL/FixJ family response regulator
MIRLFVVEDHPIIIYALKNLFSQDRDGIRVTGSAPNVGEALANARADAFDILVLDLWIGRENPEANVGLLRNAFPDTPIVIYSTEESGLWQRRMFSAGVKGYIFKSAMPDEIRSTLEKIYNGGISYPGVTSPDDPNKLDNAYLSGQKTISNLQRALISMVAQGIKQREIAILKKISVSTVEKTMLNLRRKFSAHNNTDLIRILTEKGLL